MGQKCCCCCRRWKPPDLLEGEGLMNQDDGMIQTPNPAPESSNPAIQPSSSTVQVSNPMYEMNFVVVLHPYRANGPNELTINTGDTLEIINKDDEDWWLARYPGQSDVGYIPALYVALSSSLESHEWYHGDITRMEAQQLLMSRRNSPGAFLLRKSRGPNPYALSIKTFKEDGCTPRVRHYNIVQTPDNYFAFAGQKFLTLSDLVDCFVKSVDTGLPQTMPKHPSIRPAPAMQDISRQTRDQWEIQREDLRFVRKLGDGSFGEVWLGKWNGSVDVAIKTMKEGKMNAEDFLGEAKVMKNLRHPNILALYAVCSRQDPLLIVTEYMSEGALLDLLRTESMNLQLQLHFATQVAAGMEYLENLQLIHRDLAARNILVDHHYVCKVADFGLSKLYEEAIYNEGMVSKKRLPIKWTAPEALLHQKFTSKSDVWSFGVTLMEIVTDGAIPYLGYANRELVQAISNGYRMPQPQKCPDKLYELMVKCWNIDPISRPTFYFLHDFLQNYDVQSEGAYYEGEAY